MDMFSVKLLLSLMICFAIAACDSDIHLSINETVPPTFTFERNHSEVNYLDFFLVQEISPENLTVPYSEQNSEKNHVVWQIWPKGTAEGTLSSLPPITYGKVPSGFTQKMPSEGSPPALVEGKVYEAGGPPIVMSKGIVRFKILNGKAVVVPIDY